MIAVEGSATETHQPRPLRKLMSGRASCCAVGLELVHLHRFFGGKVEAEGHVVFADFLSDLLDLVVEQLEVAAVPDEERRQERRHHVLVGVFVDVTNCIAIEVAGSIGYRFLDVVRIKVVVFRLQLVVTCREMGLPIT